MDRREAIKRVGWLMGGALSMSTVTGVLGGCKAGPAGAAFTPRTLSAPQNDLVVTLTELILPETDTPGAKAARVNEFIDVMLTEWYPQEERDRFLRGLQDVDGHAQQAHGRTFLELSAEEQNAVLAAMEEEAVAYDARQRERTNLDEFGREVEKAGSETEPADAGGERPFFGMIKELTLFGYYTSEIGASQELKYMPYGRYDGSVPFSEIGRAWS